MPIFTQDFASFPHWTVVGFAGHRRLANPDITRDALERVITRLADRFQPIAGVSSAACGADTLFAEQMHRLKLPFSIILPFPIDRFADDFADDPGGWKRAEALIHAAVKVDILHPVMPQPIAYLDTAYMTVDRADVMIVVWDGKPSNGPGGTANSVAYARATQKPILMINPETGAVSEEPSGAMDHHAEPGGDTPNALQKVELEKAASDPRGYVERHFHHLNRQAESIGPWTRRMVRVALLLSLMASIFSFAKLIFGLEDGWGTFCKIGGLICLVSAFVIFLVRSKRHSRWLTLRVKAEVCRSFLATWDIRRQTPATHPPRTAIPGMKSLFTDLRILRGLDRSPPKHFNEVRSIYNDTRVRSQIIYFARELKKSTAELRARRILMKICLGGALLCELVLFVTSVWPHYHELNYRVLSEWLEMGASTLPLIAAALGIVLITQESVRRASRYEDALRVLRALEKRVIAVETWDALARAATEVEEELLQELIEWRSFVQFTRDVAHPE